MNFVYMVAQVFVFVVLGGVLFILPQVTPDDVRYVGPIIAVLLFSIGPLCEVMIAMPACARAEAAIANIRNLEAAIDAETARKESLVYNEIEKNPFADWKQIYVKDATFQFPIKDGQHPFCLQPVNLTF